MPVWSERDSIVILFFRLDLATSRTRIFIIILVDLAHFRLLLFTTFHSAAGLAVCRLPLLGCYWNCFGPITIELDEPPATSIVLVAPSLELNLEFCTTRSSLVSLVRNGDAHVRVVGSIDTELLCNFLEVHLKVTSYADCLEDDKNARLVSLCRHVELW